MGRGRVSACNAAVWFAGVRRGSIGRSHGGRAMSRRAGVLVVPVACLALVPLAAWVGGASAAPVPKHLMKAEPHYFPTRVGTKWVYTRLGRDETHAVTKVVEKENETLVT